MTRLFGVDGIREDVGKPPLRGKDLEWLGRVLAAWLRRLSPTPIFLIGTDTRESSQRLKSALVDGLSRGGVQVVDAGILPTAAISYLIIDKGYFAGGAMISASHNPIIENGIKVFDNRGAKVSEETESFIEDLFFGNVVLPFEIRPAPVISQPELAQYYAQSLVREIQSHGQIKSRIIIDCAHGALSQIGPLVLTKLNVPHTVLNASPDGTNINRNAGSEYVRFNPNPLTQEVRRCNAELGIAFDGDADRVIFIDREGRLYDGDMVLAMLALKYKSKQCLQQDTVVLTPMSNSGLTHYLRQNQIVTRMVRNGDKYITRALVEDNLTLGGEEIGHIIAHTDDSHVTGDGLRTALLILTTLAESPDATLNDLAPGMRKWPQITASVWIGRGAFLPESKDIPGLSALLQKTYGAIPDLRLECRPASTEPVYRIMLEARTTDVPMLMQHAQTIGEYIRARIGRADSPIAIWDCTTGKKMV